MPYAPNGGNRKENERVIVFVCMTYVILKKLNEGNGSSNSTSDCIIEVLDSNTSRDADYPVSVVAHHISSREMPREFLKLGHYRCFQHTVINNSVSSSHSTL
jgi:hypothetical protein